MKKLIAILLLLPFGLIAQNSEISNLKISSQKVVTDSLVRNTDSVYISKIKSPAGRITSLKTSTLNSNVISGVQSNITTGIFTSLFVNASSQLQNFSGSIGSINELVIGSAIGSNPVFTDENGKVTKESKSQFMSIPAVAFTPENISPLESSGSSLVLGGLRKFVNKGEVEGQSLANDHLFKLVSPLVFPLNTADQNISFINARICTYDKENTRDLAAVVYEVNSSVGQFPLDVKPKMVFRSVNNNATYQCFDLKDGFGTAFPIDAANNSYYVGVFPVLASIKSDEILQSPDTYLTPWRAEDNPFLRLVHFIIEYKFQ